MAFAEPQPDRGLIFTHTLTSCMLVLILLMAQLFRYERRGWITFSYDTNIKDACTRIGATKVIGWMDPLVDDRQRKDDYYNIFFNFRLRILC